MMFSTTGPSQNPGSNVSLVGLHLCPPPTSGSRGRLGKPLAERAAARGATAATPQQGGGGNLQNLIKKWYTTPIPPKMMFIIPTKTHQTAKFPSFWDVSDDMLSNVHPIFSYEFASPKIGDSPLFLVGFIYLPPEN